MELLAGVVVVAVALFDIFQSVFLPRRTGSLLRLAPHLLVWLWPIWRRIGVRLQPAWRREDFLGTFAPFAILFLLGTWFLALIVGFGLLLHALRTDFKPILTDHLTAFYVAGTSLLTIGFGDYVATHPTARAANLLAGAAGLTIVAMVIGLTFNLYAFFSRRETMVLMLDSRAGAPPSGVTLLESYAHRGLVDQLPALFAQYELWTAEMLESHLAYPILPYFRSSHDGQSWVSTLGALLDASTLLMAAAPAPPTSPWRNAKSSAEMLYSIGCHALVDLTQNRPFHGRAAARIPGIEQSEFTAACRRLADAGCPLECSEQSWEVFARLRSVYASRLNLLARYFETPPTQWIGDRSLLSHPHVDANS